MDIKNNILDLLQSFLNFSRSFSKRYSVTWWLAVIAFLFVFGPWLFLFALGIFFLYLDFAIMYWWIILILSILGKFLPFCKRWAEKLKRFNLTSFK